VFPEIELKKYSGFSLSRPKVAVTEKDVDEVVKNFLDSQAQIVPLPEAERGRAAKQGDHVDFDFDGKLLTAEGPKDHAALKGTRTAEIGGGQLIPGFEDHLKGMKSGDSKSFTLELPKDDPELGGKSAEFSVKLNEVKQKELPKLDDELAKTWGYEGLADLRAKTKERIQKGREDEAEQRLREQLFDELIKANPFELPEAVIMSHANSLARDFAARLKQQGFSEDLIQNALKAEEEEIKKRAEGQVRAGLLIEEVAKKEKIEVTEAVVDEEIKRVAAQSQMDEAKVRAYYADPKRREDLEYRLRENATVKSMISKSKVKEA
jgi:trigger factor